MESRRRRLKRLGGGDRGAQGQPPRAPSASREAGRKVDPQPAVYRFTVDLAGPKLRLLGGCIEPDSKGRFISIVASKARHPAEGT